MYKNQELIDQVIEELKLDIGQRSKCNGQKRIGRRCD